MAVSEQCFETLPHNLLVGWEINLMSQNHQ